MYFPYKANMKYYGIVYKITNLVNNKIYIGQTSKSIKSRWYGHCAASQNQTLIARSIKKYGKDNFKIEELMYAFNKEDLNYLEQVIIETSSSLFPYGYNLSKGGYSGSLYPSMLGKKHSDFSKNKALNTNVIRGQTRSVICLSTGITYPSINQAAKKLNLNAGAIYSCCIGKALSAKGYNFEFIHNLDSYRISRSKLKRVNKPKKIVEVKCNLSFNSIKDAAKYFKLHRKTISRNLNNINKSLKYDFRAIND